MTEFNLSEKAVFLIDGYDKDLIRVGDVKEFIRLLKEELSKVMEINGYIGKIKGKKISVESIIDKLAGEKLI